MIHQMISTTQTQATKILVFVIAVVTVALVFPSSVSFVRANANPMQKAGESGTFADYKKLLFVDQSLDEIVELYKLPDNAFIRAQDLVKSGKPEKAKQVLKQLLADPGEEVRTKLWAWNCLRQLGEKPPPNVANQVQGIVMEVPVGENWIDTLAAYSDGRVRYLNGQGGGNGQGGAIIWETPEEKRISSLVATFISAGKPIVAMAPVYEKHQPAKNDVVRISLLTYGGIHIIEARQPDITPRHSLSPVYNAGTQLFLALLDENEKSK
jgi:hypothetical protein